MWATRVGGPGRDLVSSLTTTGFGRLVASGAIEGEALFDRDAESTEPELRLGLAERNGQFFAVLDSETGEWLEGALLTGTGFSSWIPLVVGTHRRPTLNDQSKVSSHRCALVRRVP